MPKQPRLAARLTRQFRQIRRIRPVAVRGHFRMQPVAQAIAMAACGMALYVGMAQPALAQAPAAAAQVARQSFSIPAGALAPALRNLASNANLLLTFTEAQTAGKTTAGINGAYTPQAALAALLAGTGLQAAPLDNGAYVLRAAPAASTTAGAGEAPAITLNSVTVTAEADRGTTEGTGSLTTGSTSAATGMNLSMRETPQSMTVVTRERLDQESLGTMAEVVEQVPGVYFNSHGTPIGGRTWIMARGFDVTSYQVDGVNMKWEALGESDQYGHAALDTAIYDSLTVVRGATGLLTGAGDPSASVSLTRKKPTPEFQASVSGSVGRWDRTRAVADISGPLNEAGSLRGRIVAAHDEGKTWVDRYSNERSIVYGVVEADISPQTLVTLAVEHARDGSKSAPWADSYGLALFYDDGVTPIVPASRNTNAAPYWAYSDTDRTSVSAAIEHRLSQDWNAKFTYAFSKFNSDMRRGMDNGIPANGSASDVRVLNLDMSNEVHTIDGKIDGKYTLLGRQHDLIAGFNLSYTDQHYRSAFYGVFPGLAQFTNGELVYGEPDWSTLDKMPYKRNEDQYGAYASTRLRPTDRLSVILGGRLTWWKTHSADLVPYSVWDDRRYSNVFTPYLGVVYDLTPEISAYGSFTEIFLPQDVKDVNGRLLDPEEGTNIEVGLKGEWFGGRLNSSVAVFQTRKNNLAVEDGINLTPDGDTAYRAESNTKGRGFEIEAAGEVARGWQVQGGYTRFLNRDSEGIRLDSTQPVHQFKLYSSYRPASLPKLAFGGGVKWQSTTRADGFTGTVLRSYTIKSYSVVNLNARYDVTPRLALSLNLNNVFNEDFRTSNYTQSYGARRNLTATLKYQF